MNDPDIYRAAWRSALRRLRHTRSGGGVHLARVLSVRSPVEVGGGVHNRPGVADEALAGEYLPIM